MREHESSTEKKYRELLEQQGREGLSREEAAARAGVKPSTLTWWRSQLKRLDRERSSPAETGGTSLLPVTIRDAAPTTCVVRPSLSAAYEVVLGRGRVLRVPRGFDASEVHALVSV